MKVKKIITLILVAVTLAPVGAYAGKSKWTSWWRPNEWYSKINKKQHSTTVTGVIDSVAADKIMFKTSDGQKILLIGRKASKVIDKRGAKIRIFGNVQKPSSKYPVGAIQVRNFKVLEKLTPMAAPVKEKAPVAEPVSEPEPYLEPEPVPEPVPVPAPAPDPDPYLEPSPAAVPADKPAPVAAPEPVPVPAVEPTPVAVTEPDYTDYVVESGDTLGKISKKMYGTTANWKKIAEFNKITDPRLLRVGKSIRIPKM